MVLESVSHKILIGMSLKAITVHATLFLTNSMEIFY